MARLNAGVTVSQTVYGLIFLLWLFSQSPAAFAEGVAASEPARQRLMLQDFNQGLGNDLVRGGTAWKTNPGDSKSAVQFRLQSSHTRGESGNALYLSYTLNPTKAATNGFRLYLKGLDASAYDHLEFWVKGDRRKGFADAFKVEFKRPYPDGSGVMEKGSYVVTGITDDWQRIRVPLNFMNGIKDWTNLKEFNIIFQSRRAAVRAGAYYLDDVALLATGNPGPGIRDKVIAVRKRALEDQLGGQDAARPYLQARLTDWPTRAAVDRRELPQSDVEFLARLAWDTWRGIDALSDREHGLPLDTVRLAKDSIAAEHSRIGDYTNVTNIGLYLVAIVGAHELQFITRQEALDRLGRTLSTLEKLETYQGFFYNYYDTTSLERTSNFISFVDSAWLTAGLMVVRTTFAELNERATKVIAQGDYGFFYDNVEQLMSHGYYVNLAYPSEYTYGCLYTESRLGSLIAIGKGEVPEEHWFKMVRTFPAGYTWQSLMPRARKARMIQGHAVNGGYYRWKRFNYVPSWGGSLFEALMPVLVLDEQRYAPHNLGLNDAVHAAVHQRYALKELGYPVWGMSPSSTPAGDGYAEYGVKILGARGYKAGAVTPHAAALALAVTPQAAVTNLRKLVELYDMYGEYGLYDAVDPRSGEVAHKYLALDQSMLFIALVNYLGDHIVQKRFASDPIMSKALPLLHAEHFFE